jgi:hypothetical protein
MVSPLADFSLHSSTEGSGLLFMRVCHALHQADEHVFEVRLRLFPHQRTAIRQRGADANGESRSTRRAIVGG